MKVVATLEHPFFVFGQGWSSCDPTRTRQRFGLDCHPLIVGDVCVSLTHKDVTKHAAEISKKQQQQQQQADSETKTVKSEPSSDQGEGQQRSPGQGQQRSPGQSQGQGSHVQDQRSGINPPHCVGQNVERSSLSAASVATTTHSQTQERSSPGS